jgi:DNA-binding NtrC family response regulator
MLRVLVVDDDQGLRFSVRETLAQTGRFEAHEACDGLEAVERVKASRYDLVILDVDMPRLNGLEALKAIKEHDPSVIVLIMTAYATIDHAVLAVKEGAYNYLSKPIKGDELAKLVDRALRAQSLVSSAAASAPVLTEAGRKIIGNSAEMRKVFNIIDRLAKVDTPVLIRGASGTGKELVARAIHFNSTRKDQKFVAINCSAIPENLFESELFGHEKGSFTGADQRKIGKFQFAEGGTLFLDELGDMPVLMQVKLLRVLQEKRFVPVGANRELETNVRIIAATNRPLEEMIKRGEFREDLFYRLNVVPIFLPPLADRKNDVERLVNTFIAKFNREHGKKIIGIAPDALACLKKYSWPGNIRELENVIEHAFILENGKVLALQSLPEGVLAATGVRLANAMAFAELDDDEAGLGGADGNGDGREPPREAMGNAPQFGRSGVAAAANLDNDADDDFDTAGDATHGETGGDSGRPAASALSGIGSLASVEGSALDFNRHKEAFEREFIIKALKTFKGRINQTALHANIPKKTLLRKIEKYGINARDYLETKN